MSTTGVDLIAAERLRQQAEEGYTRESDVRYNGGQELAAAAATYAMTAEDREYHSITRIQVVDGRDVPKLVPFPWPWGPEFWRPTPDDRLRELVKAGALLAAAIDVELARS